jgi:tetratricopeptide (TPR) repeat protein
LEIREKALGPDHPSTANSLKNLGLFYAKRGRLLQAEPLLRRALAIAEKAVGIEDPKTTRLAQTYSQVLQKLGRAHEAHNLRKRCEKR